MRRFGLYLTLVATMLAPAFAHDLELPEGPQLLVSVWVRNSGVVDLWSMRPSAIGEEDAVAAVEASLGCAFEKSGDDSHGEESELWGECLGAFDRSGMLVEGEMNLEPLGSLAAGADVPLRFDLGHPHVAHSETAAALGSFHEDWGHGYYNGYFADADPPDHASLSFGYRSRGLLCAGAAALLVILGPLPVVAWMRRRALARRHAGEERAWFDFLMPLNFILLFFWATWWAAVALWQIAYLPMFLLDMPYFGSVVWDFVRNAGWVWAPAIGSVLAARACADTASELTGKSWTRSDLTKMTAGGLAALLIPALLIFTGLNAAGAGDMASASALIIGAIFLFFIGLGMLQRYQGFTPVAVTSGELRDRVFELAKQAGVDLRQLFIIPDGRHKATNALAVGSRVVMLTESLVRGLTKAELDAVVGHELSHLKKKHTWIQLPLIVVPLAVLAVAIEVVFPHLIPVWSYGFLLATTVTLGMGWVSRSHERVADVGGVEISGEPEAFITGMVKLARLNSLPLEWGSAGDALLTHPSMQQRIDAVAAAAGISAERVNDLVADPPQGGECYEIPNVEEAEQERVFSQQARNGAAMRKTLTGLCGVVLLPATLVTIDQELGWTGTASAVWFLVSIAVSCLGIILLDRWEAPLGAAALAAKLRAKLIGQGFPAHDALVVGLGPNPEPRIYDNAQVWDLGCMFLLDDRLVYVGEEARFALSREEIDSVEVGPYRPRFYPENAVVVRWSSPEDGAVGALRMQRCEPRPLSETFRPENALAQRIQAWVAGGASSSASDAFADLLRPDVGEVSSDPCSKIYNVKTLSAGVGVAAFLGLAAALILGFGFGPLLGATGHGWKLVSLTCVSVLAAAWNDRPLGV